MATQIEDLVGEKLVIGFPGTKVTSSVLRQFKRTRAGGVIFYRINFQSPAQIKKAIKDLEEGLGRKLLVCVDHEGGRVIMYRDGVTIFPDNLAFGHSGELDLIKDAGETAAEELRALGTDVNFAPVLDVLTKAYSPNIGIRSFGEDWKTVAEMGAAYIQALQRGGVSATAKHFPGKGHAPVDAHLKLPTIISTWKDMRKVHLRPFIRAIEVGVDVIMTSHPLYPKLDPEPGNITTFSRKIVHDCLRKDLGFKGIISSDDLEMGAVSETLSIDQAAVKATHAGHDLLLSCHDYESQIKVFDGVCEAYRTKQLPLRELEQSVERIRKLKKKRAKRFEGKVGPVKAGAEIALSASRRGTRVLKDKEGILPLNVEKAGSTLVFFPALSFFAKKIMIEKAYENEKKALTARFKPFKLKFDSFIYGIHPTEAEIKRAAAAAGKQDTLIFFCFDAHLFPGQKTLLDAVQNQGKNFVAVLMRDPYDLDLLNNEAACVTAFGFRDCQIQAAVERIFTP